MANSKYNCGTILPSSCIPFSGKDLTILITPDELSCDANINDVIEKIDIAVKKLMDSNDFTALEPIEDCLEFDPATVTAKELHELEIQKLCTHEAEILALQNQLNDLDIGNEIITIDLPACLEAGAAPCAVGTNEYQLISLLMLFANKLCDHETRITNLE
jgi:hypothetical protein